MTKDGRDDMILLLRRQAQTGLPAPSAEFRRRAWRVFSSALDRHLAGPGGLRQAGTRR
jgi:hypothetical protein